MKTFAAALALVLGALPASAEVVNVNVANRGTVANGQAFGTTGPYEKLTGTIEFALDPKEPHNARVTDLDRAGRADDGRVHFTSTISSVPTLLEEIQLMTRVAGDLVLEGPGK